MIKHQVYALAFLLAAGQLNAEVRVVLPNIRPYAYYEGKGIAKGIDVDLVAAVSAQTGLKVKPQVMPLPRVIAYVEHGPKTISFLAQTPERKYGAIWLVDVFEVPFVFITRRDSKLDIGSLDAAKSLSVGVALNSIGAQMVRQARLPYVDFASDEVTNARKLMAGRIDTWLASPLAASAALKELEIPHDVHYGPAIATSHIWLVVSKDTSEADKRVWSDAIIALKNNGELANIRARWGLPR